MTIDTPDGEIRPTDYGACTYDECPVYDGKRCRLTGFRPDGCEPAFRHLRAAGVAVVEAYADCRERDPFAGFWTHVDDLSKALALEPCPVCEGPPPVDAAAPVPAPNPPGTRAWQVPGLTVPQAAAAPVPDAALPDAIREALDAYGLACRALGAGDAGAPGVDVPAERKACATTRARAESALRDEVERVKAERDDIVGKLHGQLEWVREKRREARAEVERLRRAMDRIILNDKTSYHHHEARPSDGAKPSTDGGTCWLTPREIATSALAVPPGARSPDDTHNSSNEE